MTDEMIYDACQQEYRSGYSDAMADCAEEINRLKAERDAAVADIERRCYNCKHLKAGLKQGSPCEECYAEPKGPCSHVNWIWRGLSLAAETSDKQEVE